MKGMYNEITYLAE